jgi:hypothetical protein
MADEPTPQTFETLSLGAAARTVWIFGAGASACPPYKVPTQVGLAKLKGHLVRSDAIGCRREASSSPS